MYRIEVTAANVSGVSMTPKSLSGEEKTVNGDSGYLEAQKRNDVIKRNKQGKKIRYTINRRPS